MSKIINCIPEIALFVVFGIIQISHINIDFWNDEIYTIQHFVLTSLHNTVTDYHVPNNHIFFNVICNIYLQIIGVDSLYDLFDHPWILRIVPFIYSLFTAYFIYKIGSEFVNRTVGLLALIILMTTIPFYNFSLQIRGYGLSITLGVALAYYLLSYFDNLNKSGHVKVGFLACLLFYTIPSNLYFLLSIIFALGIYLIFDKSNRGVILFNRYSYSIYAITAGTLLAVLLYLPIVGVVFSNQEVGLGNYFSFEHLRSRVIYVGYGLANHRWLIILISALGFFIGYKYLMKNAMILLLSISAITFPILIVWVTGQNAPARVFTFCLPFVSLLMAISIFAGWSKYFSVGSKKDWIVVSCVFLITMISLYHQLGQVEKTLITDIREGTRTQNMYCQYYSARYWPLSNIKSFQSIYNHNQLPVIVVGCEPHGIPNYLEKFGIPYYPESDFDSLLVHHDSLYVITNHPFQFDQRNDIDTERLNSELSYHNSLIIRKR